MGPAAVHAMSVDSGVALAVVVCNMVTAALALVAVLGARYRRHRNGNGRA